MDDGWIDGGEVRERPRSKREEVGLTQVCRRSSFIITISHRRRVVLGLDGQSMKSLIVVICCVFVADEEAGRQWGNAHVTVADFAREQRRGISDCSSAVGSTSNVERP